MCRSCAEGGRRCPETEKSREAGKAASTRYYKRGKARLLIAQLSDHGIRAMDDSAIPPTYHVGRAGEPLALDEDREIVHGEYASVDKPSEALWTAPGRVDSDGGVKTAWTDWSAIENGGSGGGDNECIHVVRAQPGAVVVSVEANEDAEALLSKYQTQDKYGRPFHDWAAMKRDGIDGVYLSPKAVPETWARGKALRQFYGWDASSVAWLSNKNLQSDAEQHPIGHYEVEYETSEDGTEDRYGDATVTDPEMGEYDTPERPSLDGAWDRVPKKVRESKGAEEGLPSETGTASDPATNDAGSARKMKVPKPKEYTEAVPRDQSLLDAGKDGVEYMRGFMEKTPERRSDAVS